MEILDVLFRLIGVFYCLGGVLGIRVVLMDSILDRALAAITLKPVPTAEKIQRALLAASFVGLGAGGAALAFLSTWALVFFVVSVLCHLTWLAWSNTMDALEEKEPVRRERKALPVSKASLVFWFVVAAAFLMWSVGRLEPLDDARPLFASGVVALLQIGWLAWTGRERRSGASSVWDQSDETPHELEKEPTSIIIDPAFGCWPLINADTGERFNHMTWLEQALAERVEEWDDLFQASFDPDDFFAPNDFGSPEADRLYMTEAEAIRAALEAVYGEGNVRFGEMWTGDHDDASSPA